MNSFNVQIPLKILSYSNETPDIPDGTLIDPSIFTLVGNALEDSNLELRSFVINDVTTISFGIVNTSKYIPTIFVDGLILIHPVSDCVSPDNSTAYPTNCSNNPDRENVTGEFSSVTGNVIYGS